MNCFRFENAVAAAEKASKLDYSNFEVARIVNVVKMVARARSRGNELFSSGKFSEACSAYGEGLKYDNTNYVLYCNRAICWSKLGLWEQSVQDCNQALNIQPNYTKALSRRAASNSKVIKLQCLYVGLFVVVLVSENVPLLFFNMHNFVTA